MKAALVRMVRSMGRALEVFAEKLELLAKRRLSWRQVIIVLVAIFAALSLLFYYCLCNGILQSQAAERLWDAVDAINLDLREHGTCDLSDVRKRDYQWGGAPLPLLWTKVDVISNRAEYEGHVVCAVPRARFGKLAWFTVGLVLKHDSGMGGYRVEVVDLRGRPDFVRERAD